MTETQKTETAQTALAAVAVDLDAVRDHISHLRDDLGQGGWPQEMEEGTVAPSLAWRLFIDVRMLLEEYLEPAVALARGLSSLSVEKCARDWEASLAADLEAGLYVSLSQMARGAQAAAALVEKVQQHLTQTGAASTLTSDLVRLRETAAELDSQAARIQAAASGKVEDDEDEGVP